MIRKKVELFNGEKDAIKCHRFIRIRRPYRSNTMSSVAWLTSSFNIDQFTFELNRIASDVDDDDDDAINVCIIASIEEKRPLIE